MMFLAAIFMIQAIFGLNYKVSIDTELVKSRGSASTFYPNSLDHPLVVDGISDPSLKLQIKLQEKDTLELLSANQVFFTLENQFNADDRTSFVVSKKGAVYSVELNAKNFASGSFIASLYIVDETLDALKYSFGSINIYNGKDVPVDLYLPLKEIIHKFQPEVKDPADFIPNLFSVLTIVPWAILYVLWSSQGANLRNYTANASHLIFGTFYLIFLALSLLLFHTFWLKLNLFKLFAFGAPLWGITAIVGRFALIQRADLRAPKEIDE